MEQVAAIPEPGSIKAILFDLDGVLMLSNELHAHAYRLAFEAEGIHDFSHTEIAGMRTDEVVRQVLLRNQHTAHDAAVHRVTQQKREHAKALFATQVPAIDGSGELLATLHRHIPLALATSASANTANAFLGVREHRSFFRFVICGPEVAQSKPHPEIYLRAMQALGVEAQQCLVVEDSLNGIEAGRAAGAYVAAVKGTFAPEQLLAHGAFTVLESALGLPHLLELE